MRKKILLLSILVASMMTAQTNLYENPNFDQITKDHQSIAILPFIAQVNLKPKQMIEISDRKLDKIERAKGEGIQAAMFSWFLKRKKRGKFDLQIQDINKTNAILSENNIDYYNLKEQHPENLAKLLGVDAVISGDFETNKPMSEAGTIVLGILLGFWGNTNSAVINIKIHNGEDGELLSNYNKQIDRGIGSSPERLVNVLMRKASRRLAYTD